jgi:hypothetical protein
MNETTKTKWYWRLLRWGLIALAFIITLAAVVITEEDWRGKRDWEAYKLKWEAKGEKFDWQAFVPPTVPNDQNFFRAPIFTNMLDGKIVMSPSGADGGPDIRPEASQSGYAVYPMRITDLQAWQNYYRNPTNIHAVTELVMTNGTLIAETNYLNHATDKFPIASQPQTPAKDVLLALSKFDSAIKELRQASQRPYSDLPLDYKKGFNVGRTLFPYLGELKLCSQTLQLRAGAELADGESAKALDDVKLMLYLNNSLRTSPFLISALVRIAITRVALQPIWEGLAEHKWSDEQLAVLEAELAQMDFLADYEFVMRGERAFAIASLENQRRTREIISYTDRGMVTNKLTFMPGAYFYRSELAIAQMQQQWLLPLVDTNSNIVSPETMRRVDAAVRAAKKHYSFYKVQAIMLAPALDKAAKQFAIAQTGINLARVACALERYRLAHGEYPETLDPLTPEFIAKLPHDIINGQPLHYHRTDDGQFVLYSVGWDGTDDGGKPALRNGGLVDVENGDWVWRYPAK